MIDNWITRLQPISSGDTMCGNIFDWFIVFWHPENYNADGDNALLSFIITIIIITFYFENVAFFHAKLESNICVSELLKYFD